MSKKNKKQKLFKRSKFRQYRKSIIWVSFLIILLYGISFWTNQENFKINQIDITGNRFVQEQEILNIVEEKMKDKYLFLISKDNYFFIPSRSIKNDIESIVSVKNVIIDKHELKHLKIEIIEHQPVALYCLEECYFVNDKGLFFVEAPETYLDELITLEAKLDIQETIVGQYFIEKEAFSDLIEKTEILETENIDINKISTEDFQTFVLHTVGGPTLLVEKDDTPQEVVDNLKSALAQESIHEIQFNNIDYIDLRFEDKVFYKLK